MKSTKSAFCLLSPLGITNGLISPRIARPATCVSRIKKARPADSLEVYRYPPSAEIDEPAVRRHAIVALHGPSAQRLHPGGDGPPDLVRRIFLEKMESRDRHLGLPLQPAREIEIRAAGDEETGLGLHE